jgi:hypothetical protein
VNDPRLDTLLDRYLNGTLSEAERTELEHTLLANPAARTAFWQQARHHALLARWGQETWGQRRASERGNDSAVSEQPAPSTSASARTVAFPQWWLGVGALAAACLLIVITLNPFSRTGTVVADPSSGVSGVAVLAAAVGAEWSDPTTAPGAGSVLVPGAIELKSGALQIEFYSGARVVVEGPARLRLVSELAAICDHGSLSAYVPPSAQGFAITTPGLVVTDLGTEFGVRVPVNGKPEVHVFTGLVEVARVDRTLPVLPLKAGNAVRAEAASYTTIPVERAGFLTEAELAARLQADSGRLLDRWRQSASQLSRDPATAVHFTFEGEQRWERRLANHAAAGASSEPASVIGSAWVDGRWPGKGALEFKGPGDRVRFTLPGEFAQVTLLAWVRLDALPEKVSATLMAANDLVPGVFRWTITANGGLRLGISKTDDPASSSWEAVNSPPVITRERLGEWVMLASVYDGTSIQHYLNGRLVQKTGAHVPMPLRVGVADLGNWRADGAERIQARMDQFALLKRAATADEIRAWYDSGRPTARTDASTP